jgi:hypothetical protein
VYEKTAPDKFSFSRQLFAIQVPKILPSHDHCVTASKSLVVEKKQEILQAQDATDRITESETAFANMARAAVSSGAVPRFRRGR